MLLVADLDEEKQEHDRASEECENIEGKEANTQLKYQRELGTLSNDVVCLDNIFYEVS